MMTHYRWGLAAGIGIGLGLFAYSHWVEPGWLQVVTVPIEVDGLDPTLDSFRLAQVSDIHMNRWMNAARLERIVHYLNALQPDVVALTGDFAYHDVATYVPPMAGALAMLQPTEISLAVYGNHDHQDGLEIVQDALLRAGTSILNNSVYVVRRGKARLAFAGVDDPGEGCDRIDDILAALPPGVPAILLAHEPDFAGRYAATRRFTLQLSGHSHGGHIRLPLIGSLARPRFARKYPYGLRVVDGMWVYTNRGLGAIPLRLRFNCRPEITLFILSRRKAIHR